MTTKPVNMSTLSNEEMNREINKGYNDISSDKTKDIDEVFAAIKEDYGLSDINEKKLGEADHEADKTSERLSHGEVFSSVRSALHVKKMNVSKFIYL